MCVVYGHILCLERKTFSGNTQCLHLHLSSEFFAVYLKEEVSGVQAAIKMFL